MKLAISYRHVESSAAAEKAVGRRIGKIERLLKSYASDLVALRGHFDKHPRRTEFTCSLNLSLPTGTLHASASAADPETSAREAFTELANQIKKHQARLRKDFEWKRKRGRMEKALA